VNSSGVANKLWHKNVVKLLQAIWSLRNSNCQKYKNSYAFSLGVNLSSFGEKKTAQLIIAVIQRASDGS